MLCGPSPCCRMFHFCGTSLKACWVSLQKPWFDIIMLASTHEWNQSTCVWKYPCAWHDTRATYQDKQLTYKQLCLICSSKSHLGDQCHQGFHWRSLNRQDLLLSWLTRPIQQRSNSTLSPPPALTEGALLPSPGGGAGLTTPFFW